jgi:hypothetical protein
VEVRAEFSAQAAMPRLRSARARAVEIVMHLLRCRVRFWHERDQQTRRSNVRFSNRPFRVKRFQTIHHYSFDVAHGLVLLFGIGTRGPSIMGFEDEAEQSFGRPCRQTNGRSKRTCELTSSIVPRGTSFHRSVESRVSFYWIRCCTVFMLLLWPVLGSSGTRCRQPICDA